MDDKRLTEASLISRLSLDCNRLSDTLLQMRAQGVTGSFRIRSHVPETLIVVHVGAQHLPRAPMPLRARARAVVDNVRAAGPGGLARKLAQRGLLHTARALCDPAN